MILFTGKECVIDNLNEVDENLKILKKIVQLDQKLGRRAKDGGT